MIHQRSPFEPKNDNLILTHENITTPDHFFSVEGRCMSPHTHTHFTPFIWLALMTDRTRPQQSRLQTGSGTRHSQNKPSDSLHSRTLATLPCKYQILACCHATKSRSFTYVPSSFVVFTNRPSKLSVILNEVLEAIRMNKLRKDGWTDP